MGARRRHEWCRPFCPRPDDLRASIEFPPVPCLDKLPSPGSRHRFSVRPVSKSFLLHRSLRCWPIPVNLIAGHRRLWTLPGLCPFWPPLVPAVARACPWLRPMFGYRRRVHNPPHAAAPAKGAILHLFVSPPAARHEKPGMMEWV